MPRKAKPADVLVGVLVDHLGYYGTIDLLLDLCLDGVLSGAAVQRVYARLVALYPPVGGLVPPPPQVTPPDDR